MNLNCKTLLGLTALTVSGLAANPARAQITLTPANSNVGTPGTPSGGTVGYNGTLIGNSGTDGYYANGSNSTSFIVNGPSFTGGIGGDTTGSDATLTYQGGDGGSGLQVGKNATAAINSGTFIGGLGGTADGLGLNLIGGYGGSALNVNTAIANVYGGTFLGGDSGAATGTGNLGSQFAGSGVNANNNSIVNIYGGTFTGGHGNSTGNGGTTDFQNNGDGLIDLSGALNVYGGTFSGGTGGTSGYGIDVFVGTTTLYGTNFFVNGVAAPNGPITGMGTITGNFLDNTGSSTLTYRVIGGTLDLNTGPVPEASTTVSLGLLLALGVGGVAVAARRKKSAA